MKNKIALTITATIALSSTAAMAQMNQSNHHGKTQDHSMMSQQLKLTDEQRAAMKELRESMKQEKINARAAQHAEMAKFYDNPEFNADAAKALAQKHKDERTVRKMKNHHSMAQILTPEQRAQFREMKQNHHKGQHNKMNNRNAHGKKDHMRNGNHAQ